MNIAKEYNISLTDLGHYLIFLVTDFYFSIVFCTNKYKTHNLSINYFVKLELLKNISQQNSSAECKLYQRRNFQSWFYGAYEINEKKDNTIYSWNWSN